MSAAAAKVIDVYKDLMTKSGPNSADSADWGLAETKEIKQILLQAPSSSLMLAECYQILGAVFARRYSALGGLDDLNEAIVHSRKALNLNKATVYTSEDGLERAKHLGNLAFSLTQRYQKLGNIKDLEAALQYHKEALRLTTKDHPDRAWHLQSIAFSLSNQYQRLGDFQDLEAAIKRDKEAVDLTPPDHPDRAYRVNSLASSWNQRFQKLGDIRDLKAALQKYKEAVDLTPPDHPERAPRLHNLAGVLNERYQRLGDIHDLEAALQNHKEAVDLTPRDHPDRVSRVQGLAECWSQQFQRFGDIHDLEAALQNHREAVDLTPADHPDRAFYLGNLVVSLAARYGRLEEIQDLESILQSSKEIVDLTPPDHPDRASHVHYLALLLNERYQRLGDFQDLEAALKSDKEAVDLTSPDHPDRASHVHNLAVTKDEQFKRLGDIDDLEVALQKHQEAVDLTPPDHPERASRVHSLALSFGLRYDRLGDIQDLEARLQKHKEAVDLTPRDHPDRAIHLRTLAGVLNDRYQRLGDIQNLQAALQNHKEAVDLTPPDHADKAFHLGGLGLSLYNRYQRLGDFQDLEASLQYIKEAVDLTTPDQDLRKSNLANLAMCFDERYRRSGEIQDLEAALQSYKEAVDLTPPDHYRRAHFLGGLAVSLGSRYERLGEIQDLEAALQSRKEALQLTPADNPNRAFHLKNHAVSLIQRFRGLGDIQDLEAALQQHKEAVDLTPLDHPHRASCFQSLAFTYMERYRTLREAKDLEHIFQNYTSSFTASVFSDPESSWNAALQWASFARQYQLSSVPIAYSAAFGLLSEILWMGHAVSHRHDTISRLNVAQVTSDAVRACLSLAFFTPAVEIIEQGLAIAFQQTLQLKMEPNKLSSDEAKTFQKLSAELYTGTAVDPMNTAIERKILLEKIRKQSSHEYFLLPKPYSVLCQAAQCGPIAILTSHEDGCDAIIIPAPASNPVHVPLPAVTLALLKSQKEMMHEVLTRCNVRTRDQARLLGRQEGFNSRPTEECFSDLLQWQWTNIVEPIYQALASHNIHGGRLWWMPAGEFTSLPLHASAPNDPYIHSYTATLGSLLEARKRKPVSKPQVGVIGVTHTDIRGSNYLKGVRPELEKICSVIKSPDLKCLRGEQSTPEAVRLQLQNCSWVHLACHGVQDLMHPTKSRLRLYGGDLELEAILRMPLSNADFVFLSACQTAMGDANLVNESFHLGGGFIAAGFRSAVGTLWSMNDQDGPYVAETFYNHLFSNGQQPQASYTAEALQLAVNGLKARTVPHERWVPFIHMGV